MTFSATPIKSSAALRASCRALAARPRAATRCSRISTLRCNAWFKFGDNGASSEESGIYGSQTRDDFSQDDVEHYFNYMGRLAVEGTYDSLYKIIKCGMHPVDIILLWACEEGDTPKVEELLQAGADVNVKDLKGNTPLQLASKEEIKDMLMQAGASV